MNEVRMKRLQSDEKAVRDLARAHPRIDVEGVSGNPPDRYILIISVPGLRRQSEELVGAKTHKLEIRLPREYPRDAPVCRMLTPVFHPNIAPHAVCIGDHWTAAESLDLLIQRVGEMICFQSYNTMSPLNGHASQWADENRHRLPLLRTEFFVDMQPESETQEPADGDESCANCGAVGLAIETCSNNHKVCPQCVLHCQSCGRFLCLQCGETRCPECERECSNCGSFENVTVQCSSGHFSCSDCVPVCEDCGRKLCLTCGETHCPEEHAIS
jgi:ubiquitin-protein ligase